MRKIELSNNESIKGVELVVFPNTSRRNGNSILSKGLAGVYRQKALSVGIDLERLVSTEEPSLLDGELAVKIGGRAIFVPCIDLNTGEVDWDKIESAIRDYPAPQEVVIYYWDEQSRVQAEKLSVYGVQVRYNALEAFRAKSSIVLTPTWDKETAFSVLAHPRIKIPMAFAEAFMASVPTTYSTFVTLARVSNIPFVQAARAIGKEIIIVDPGLLASWRPETLQLLEGLVVVKTSEIYTPGAVTEAARWIKANVGKSFGVEPTGLRSEAGLLANNLWDKVKSLVSVPVPAEV